MTGGPVTGGPVTGGPVAGGPVAGGPVAGTPVAGGPDRPVGLDRVLAALEFAVLAHDGQLRKSSSTPYVVHPIRVAARVARFVVDDPRVHEDMIVAAALHDVLEDTDAGADRIEAHFGQSVLALVRELTQDKSLPKAERKRRMLEHCAAMSEPAKRIKLADRLDNVAELAVMSPEFVARYAAETRTLVDRLRGTDPALEAEILRHVDAAERSLRS